MNGYLCIVMALKIYKIIVLNVRFIHFNKVVVILIYEKLLRMAIIEIYVQM